MQRKMDVHGSGGGNSSSDAVLKTHQSAVAEQEARALISARFAARTPCFIFMEEMQTSLMEYILI